MSGGDLGAAARLAPQVLGAVIRRYRDFDAAEDAVQEALLAAAAPGPGRECRTIRAVADPGRIPPAGRPGAQRQTRRRREDAFGARWQESGRADAGRRPDAATTRSSCSSCAATRRSRPPSAIALTLRAVGGLTTAEIANAFLVPEATMAQRISRAKQTRQGLRRALPAAGRRRVGRAAARRAARAVPDLQRGLHEQRRSATSSDRASERGDPPDADGARAPARRPRGGRPAGAHAAHRRAAASANRARGRADPARRTGPVPLGPARSPRGSR